MFSSEPRSAGELPRYEDRFCAETAAAITLRFGRQPAPVAAQLRWHLTGVAEATVMEATGSDERIEIDDLFGGDTLSFRFLHEWDVHVASVVDRVAAAMADVVCATVGESPVVSWRTEPVYLEHAIADGSVAPPERMASLVSVAA